jgi:hypothetical protein
LQNYIGTHYHFYALKNPTVQAILKKGFTFSNEPMEAQMELYTRLWNQSNCYEIMYLSLMYLTIFSKKNKGLVAHETAKNFLPKIDNWAHRDFLSSIIGRNILKNKKYTLNETDFIQFINPIINDKEYFVQQAIGWLLREFGLRFPIELVQFLYKNAPQISSVTFASAKEKIDVHDKGQLKKIRADFKKIKI